jgi:hypothetical protein
LKRLRSYYYRICLGAATVTMLLFVAGAGRKWM